MRALAIALSLMLAAPALAVQPGEILPDAAQEERARALSKELRCLVCRNQSIDDSDAELARDLRVLVRERISAGDSDDEAMNYIVDRYGEYVLLKPRFSLKNAALWLGPAFLLLLGAGVVVASRRRPVAAAAPEPLTEEERARLAELTAGDPR